MAEYLAYRISIGALRYEKVIVKFSNIKEKIDEFLKQMNKENLIIK